MEKRAKQLEYLITSMILLGIGMLFFFMNESVNTYTVLRFGLFQIMQSVLLLICAILLWYRAYVVRREQETAEGGAETLGAAQAAPEEAGEEKREAKRDAVDSVNATMLLVVATVLVVGNLSPEINFYNLRISIAQHAFGWCGIQTDRVRVRNLMAGEGEDRVFDRKELMERGLPHPLKPGHVGVLELSAV